MTSHLEWLIQKREAFQRDVEAAQLRLAGCEELIKMAQQEEKEYQEDTPPAKPKQEPGRVPNIDIAAKILQEKGPLTISEIVQCLEKAGRQTTTGAIGTSLYRSRGKRFDRSTKTGKWHLIPQGQKDAES